MSARPQVANDDDLFVVTVWDCRGEAEYCYVVRGEAEVDAFLARVHDECPSLDVTDLQPLNSPDRLGTGTALGGHLLVTS